MGVTLSEWLPAMEAAIGFDATRAFLLRHSGRQVVVPVRSIPDDPAREWLRRELGFGRLTVPMGPATRRHRQLWTARALFSEGASLSQVAATFNVHTRTAAKWRAALTLRGLLGQPALAGTHL